MLEASTAPNYAVTQLLSDGLICFSAGNQLEHLLKNCCAIQSYRLHNHAGTHPHYKGTPYKNIHQQTNNRSIMWVASSVLPLHIDDLIWELFLSPVIVIDSVFAQ